MKDVIMDICGSYQRFFGGGVLILLFWGSVTYLAVKEKECRYKKYLLGFLLLFAFIYCCPLTAYVIMEYCIGDLVYWRMFWLVPVTILIAYMLASEIGSLKRSVGQGIALAGILLALIQGGSFLYTENFSERQNRYKLYQEILLICDMIEEDAQKQGIEEKGLITVNDLVSQIRQYDAGIRMPYGRNAVRGDKVSKKSAKIYQIMNEGELNTELLAEHAKKGNYQYLAFYDEAYKKELKQAGYIFVGDAGAFDVYRLEGEP